jgi:hypothetical protein
VAEGQATYTAAVPPVTECTYETAHSRVRQWRGDPAQHRCAVCGQRQAQVWAHVHRSTFPVLHEYRSRYGTGRKYRMPYSGFVLDYIAVDRRCHALLDGGHNLTRRDACESRCATVRLTPVAGARVTGVGGAGRVTPAWLPRCGASAAAARPRQPAGWTGAPSQPRASRATAVATPPALGRSVIRCPRSRWLAGGGGWLG